jgi:hypothetical protein
LGNQGEEQFVSLAPDRIQLLALGPHDREDRLGDAARMLARERPLLQGRQLLAEERVRVGHVLVEGPWEDAIEHGTVARSAGPPQKGIDRPGLSPAR